MMRRPFPLRALAGALLLASGGAAFAQAQNTTSSYQYDANGNLTQVTDPLGHVTNHSYDALNRRQQQWQPAPAAGAARPTIRYGYDSLDRLTSVTDPRNLVTSYTVDGLGNQTSLASPDTGSTTSTYDAAGNLKTRTDARGKTTTFTHDALNRLTKAAYADGFATQFEYDGGAAGAPHAKGRLTRMTDEVGPTTYAYGPLGRLQGKVQAMGYGSAAKSFTVGYAYGTTGSSTGALVSVTYPSGIRVNAAHDSAGRISSLALNPTNTYGSGTDTGVSIPLLTDIGYQPFGPVHRWTWGNSSPTSPNTYARGFDLDGRLTSYPLGNGVNNGASRTVAYDAASRITGTSHSGAGAGANAPAHLDQGFQYDDLDRLKGMTGGTTSQGYQYDANGNRTQATFGGTAYGNTIAANSNKLTNTTGPAPAKTNIYDAAGNLVGDGTVAYAYSARGRMASATSGGNTVAYLYNGWGQRVKKSGPAAMVASGTNYYVYDEAGHLLGEYEANGKVIQETVWLGDMPVAVVKHSVTGAAPNQVTATDVYHVYADHLNTPRVITRATDNQMVWRWDHADPFGMFPPDENPSGLGTFTYNPRSPGQYFDKETNLHYNWHRSYDPQLGRYTTFDPLGLAAGINGYIYVNNQPTRYVDPDGLQIVVPAPAPPAPGGGTSTPGGGRGGYDPRMDIYTPSPNFIPDWLRDLIDRPKDARSQGTGAEARPPDVNPGRDCDGRCNPCPPNPPSFDHQGDAHGSNRGSHSHQWQYHQAPDCTCRARKESW